MDSLKLLQLNYVKLSGSYDDFPEDLRWLCWHGFHLETLPDFFMGNLVALDMSYSKLKLFEPPMVGILVYFIFFNFLAFQFIRF